MIMILYSAHWVIFSFHLPFKFRTGWARAIFRPRHGPGYIRVMIIAPLLGRRRAALVALVTSLSDGCHRSASGIPSYVICHMPGICQEYDVLCLAYDWHMPGIWNAMSYACQMPVICQSYAFPRNLAYAWHMLGIFFPSFLSLNQAYTRQGSDPA